MFRLINDWLKLQQSEIPSFIHQRTWPRICIPGNIREKLFMVQINKIFHGQPSASSHPPCKDWGRMEGEVTGILFFLPFPLFPLSAPSAESQISFHGKTQPGEMRLSSFSSPPKLVWTHCVQRIKSKSHLHIFMCVGKGSKTRNSVFGKDAQSWEEQVPLEKASRIILIIWHFQALETYFQVFERTKIIL